jgi:ribonuclease VapC
MIVDSSALLAILRDEPDAEFYAEALDRAPSVAISAVNFVETGIIVDASRDPIASHRFDELCKAANLGIEAVSETQARLARQAYRDYGKGSGHKAQLNMGDCFAYALAKDKDDTLLFKGNDFARTDIRSALKR